MHFILLGILKVYQYLFKSVLRIDIHTVMIKWKSGIDEKNPVISYN